MVWGVTQSHLVVLVLAGEERQPEEELGDDRAERPHVDGAAWEDGRGVREICAELRRIAPRNCAAEWPLTVLAAEQHLGRPVEPRLDVDGEALVGAAGRAKVNQLDRGRVEVLQQDVLGLDVAVDDPH